MALLLARFAWGECSGPLCQLLAAAAIADGLVHPIVKRMAAAGSKGAFPGVCARDIQRMWPDMLISAGVRIASIPMQFKRGARDVLEEVPLFGRTGVHKLSYGCTCVPFHLPWGIRHLLGLASMCHSHQTGPVFHVLCG